MSSEDVGVIIFIVLSLPFLAFMLYVEYSSEGDHNTGYLWFLISLEIILLITILTN